MIHKAISIIFLSLAFFTSNAQLNEPKDSVLLSQKNENCLLIKIVNNCYTYQCSDRYEMYYFDKGDSCYAYYIEFYSENIAYILNEMLTNNYVFEKEFKADVIYDDEIKVTVQRYTNKK